jgi:YegS/Rv2252/BmrU family lipid kinase
VNGQSDGTLRRATVLVNPAARRVTERFEATAVIRYLAQHGVEADLVIPDSAEGATRAARAAAQLGHDAVFAIGGDGTLRDCAAGLAGTETALAALPAGTANVFCREINIPRGLRAGLDAHLHGQLAWMDLGRAGGQPFLLMASAGWDARVAASVSGRLKRRFGEWAYILQGLWMARGMRNTPMTWRSGIAVNEIPAVLMVMSNTRLYGGRVRFSPNAMANDGLLDVVAISPRGPRDVLRVALKLLARRLADDRAVAASQQSELTIETPGIAVQADGDFLGETPMRFAVEPASLLVSLPAGRLPSLLAP